MGQGNFVSVVYGVTLADDALLKRMRTEDGDWTWEDVSIPREQRLDWKETPTAYYGGVAPMVGYRVASSNGTARDGETDLDGVANMRLADFAAEMERRSEKAKTAWARFAEWMKTRGYDLPPPELLWVSDYD